MQVTLRKRLLNIVRNKFGLDYVKDDSSLIHAMERVAVLAFIERMPESPELCEDCLRKMPRGISRKAVRWMLATVVILAAVLCWLFYSIGAASQR